MLSRLIRASPCVVAEKTAEKEKIESEVAALTANLDDLKTQLKAKGLLSQMLSLPEDWDYTLQGLARINRESIDAIRQAIRELEQTG